VAASELEQNLRQTCAMRYHKANEISKSDAEHIIATSDSAVTDIVVISHGERWFDVRSMTSREIDAFVADLAREELAEDDDRQSLPN